MPAPWRNGVQHAIHPRDTGFNPDAGARARPARYLFVATRPEGVSGDRPELADADVRARIFDADVVDQTGAADEGRHREHGRPTDVGDGL